MSKVVRAVVGIGLIVAGVFMGGTTWPLAVMALGGGIAASALQPKVNMPSVSEATSGRLNKSLEPEAFRKIAFGTTALGTDTRYWEVYEGQSNYDEVIALAGHEITSFDALYVEDELVSFDGSGNATGTYAGALSIKTELVGSSGSTLSGVGAGAKWATGSGESASMTGMAYMVLKWVWSQEKLPRGFPTRITPVGKGALVYDPRLDSTRGGTGSHRADDQSTWAFTTTDSNGQPIGRNPALQILHYLLGWYVQNPSTSEWVLVHGMGIDPDDIDFSSFITAANECEAEEYYADCLLSTGDNHATNLGVLEQACAGKVSDAGGLYTLRIQVDDFDGSLTEFTDDDVVGECDWRPEMPLAQSAYNQIVGQFIDPDALYQLRPLPLMRDTAYETADGEKVRTNVRLDAVQDSDQGQKLLRIRLNKSRQRGMFEAPFGWRAVNVRVGQPVKLTLTRFGFDERYFRVRAKKVDPGGAAWLALETDHPDVYTGGTVATLPTAATGAGYDPTSVATPTSDEWGGVGGSITVTDGVEVPAVTIDAGETAHPTGITGILAYTSQNSNSGPWNLKGEYPPGTESFILEGLLANETYYVRLAYRNAFGVIDPASASLILGPYTTGSLVATDAVSVGGVASDRVAQSVDDGEVMAEVIIREALDRRDRIRAEIDGVWGTFGTANAFLLEVQDWTDQAEQFSIVASSSATTAGNAATASAGYRDQAFTYAGNAGNSASAASTSATAAAASETAAGNSATAASGFSGTAQTAATAAGDSASAASTSATAAAASETAAGNSATAASGSASTAATSATAAGDSASTASTSATAAASASDAAGDSASAASGFASDASASATSAGEEAAATLTLRTEAQTAASNAATSATQAATASTNASSSSTAASNSATAAGNSATASSNSAATADTHRAAAAANAILAAQYGASAKTDVSDAEDFFTTDLAGLDYSAAAFTGWTEDSISSVGPVVYSTTSTISFGSRARFNPKPGRRYRVTAIWRWTTGTVGTVSVGFRADPLDTGSSTNRWSSVTAGSVNEWREASYEITATEAMADESWRPVIYRTGNTGRIEIRALVWEDLSAFRAVGQDSVSVYSTAEEAFAARIIQVSAGDAFAAIQLAARQSDGTASSVLRFAAQLFGFGADFDNPRFFIDAINDVIYGVADDGTTRVFELDFAADGRLRLRKPDDTLLFDSSNGGVQLGGVETGLIADRGRHFTASHTWLTGSPAYTATDVHNFTGSTSAITVKAGDAVDLDWSYEVVLPANSAKWVYFWEVIKRGATEIRRVERHVGAGQAEGNVSGNQSSAGEEIRPSFSANTADAPAAGDHTYTISLEKRAVGGQYIDGGQSAAAGMTMENINLKVLAQRDGPTRNN